MDKLLKEFFEIRRWEEAIDTGVEKKLNRGLLKQLCTPAKRIELYQRMKNDEYKIQPPHTAQIPKDDGTFRTVYINTDLDRIVLSIINDMLFELCPEMIHPRCVSYQKGIGCSQIVCKISKKLPEITDSNIGVKSDLSKYFDSVELPFIEEIFDKIETKFGASKILDILRDYYRNDTIIDKGVKTQKYTSLKQGCAVAAFLADAVLFNMDSALDEMCHKYPIEYYRYSDDTLIIGPEYAVTEANEVLNIELAKKSLKANPKKTQILTKDKWFVFLGYALKDNQITLSKNRVKTFQNEIEARTIKAPKKSLIKAVNDVQKYLYKGEYNWCKNVLTTINNEEDIQTLNTFVLDAIRGVATHKTKIGGLGSDFNNPDKTIIRGKGKNVRANREKLPLIKGFYTLKCMKNAYITNKALYETLARTI